MEERVVLASVATGRFSAVIDQGNDGYPVLHITFTKKEANKQDQQSQIDIPVGPMPNYNYRGKLGMKREVRINA